MIVCRLCKKELEENLFYACQKSVCIECYNSRRRNKRALPICRYCKKEYPSEGKGRYRFCSTKCRFMSKVKKDEATGCWNWTAGHTKTGYGNFTPEGKRNGSAHRMSYELFKGTIKESLHVLHSCNNPACVNPDHLRTGTPADNAKDKSLAGRGNQPKGESHPKAKLTTLDIKMIRTLGDEGYAYRCIAKLFKVTHFNIRQIVNRKLWKHVL